MTDTSEGKRANRPPASPPETRPPIDVILKRRLGRVAHASLAVETTDQTQAAEPLPVAPEDQPAAWSENEATVKKLGPRVSRTAPSLPEMAASLDPVPPGSTASDQPREQASAQRTPKARAQEQASAQEQRSSERRSSERRAPDRLAPARRDAEPGHAAEETARATSWPQDAGRPAVPKPATASPVPMRAQAAPTQPVGEPPVPAPAAAESTVSLWRSLAPVAGVGGAVVVLFFFVLGGWAATAQLSSAAIAPGVVSPEGRRRTVQHLEGGIINEILVNDGSVVAAGEPLVILEDLRDRAAYSMLQSQYYTALATQSRLMAEQIGLDEVVFEENLLEAARQDRQVAQIRDAQKAVFAARGASIEQRRGILRQRIAQLQEEIVGLEALIASQQRQSALIGEEVAGVQELVEKGLERRPRLLSLLRRQVEIDGERAENRARVARAGQAIGETELQLESLETDRQDEVTRELSDLRPQLFEVEERMSAQQDVLDRTVIRAPVTGEVVDLQFRTRGGVIRPGERVLDIVPQDDILIIEAQVRPSDVDDVVIGGPALVHLTAFKQRNLPRINGSVIDLSADRFQDEVTGQTYFVAKIKVNDGELENIGQPIELVPGMPAEAMILTGERTTLEYLAEPLTEVLRRGLREP